MGAPKFNKQRLATYPIEEVAPLIPSLPVEKWKTKRVELDGEMVFTDSLRLLCFKKDGFICTKCGRKAAFFAMEKQLNDKHYHLELYALDDNGNEICMTKDHRIPRAKGGPNTIENLDCMCEPCNLAKGTNIL